jgi:hypothetical protein
MKTMRVVVEIDVDDLPADERKRHAKEMEIAESDIPALANTDAREAAECLENLGEEMLSTAFDGSDTFVIFKDLRVLSAEWQP